ncbi:hypothetical protein AB0N88_14950 [Streptomyces sp. NPDC093516]|uniref:hypothetical protein n=1 Tax=Streptomyces sp. NPDC093516 TaxID=3155304 RepID=UPI00343C3448
MSTEAPRASFPPRPAHPPAPAQPPATAPGPRDPGSRTPGDTPPPDDTGSAPAGSTAAGRSDDRRRTGSVGTTGPAAAGTTNDHRRTAPAPASPTAAGTGSAPVGPAGPAAARTPDDRRPHNPRFPSFGAAAARRDEPASPPPPHPSSRFPDAPPDPSSRFPDAPPHPSSRLPDAPPRASSRLTDLAPRPEGDREVAPETPTRPFRLTPRGGTRPHGTPSAQRPAGGGGTRATGESQRPVPPLPAEPPRGAVPPQRSHQRPVPPVPAHRPGPDARPGTDTAPVSPDPALSWSAPLSPGGAPGATRPHVSFGEPEGYDGDARPRPLGRRGASQAAAAAVCLVLGLGLMSGAVTGGWLVGDPGEKGARSTFSAAGSLWHSVPVDQLFPRTVQGRGAGPGGADRTWTRIAVAPDSGCKDAFDPLLRKALAPVGCARLLRATYTDATESHVTTVGLLFTKADAPAMTSLADRFRTERLDRRSDLMPLPYAAKDTPAADFGAKQRASWTVSVLTEAPVVVYAVSGWADGRTVDDPQPAGDAMESGATTAPAQAGLGHEAQGLADRVERDLRKNVRSATEQPS